MVQYTPVSPNRLDEEKEASEVDEEKNVSNKQMDEWGQGVQTSAGATVMIGGWNIYACMEAGRANLLPMIHWETGQIHHREGPSPRLCLDGPVCSTDHKDRAKSSLQSERCSCSETRSWYSDFHSMYWDGIVIYLHVGKKEFLVIRNQNTGTRRFINVMCRMICSVLTNRKCYILSYFINNRMQNIQLSIYKCINICACFLFMHFLPLISRKWLCLAENIFQCNCKAVRWCKTQSRILGKKLCIYGIKTLLLFIPQHTLIYPSVEIFSFSAYIFP